ncbi:MAG: DUF349 domain-containing protein [Cytophagales bacterium]|nr:DUF349 domain-containing protein [Cytophagales bacterium]
MEKYGTEGNNFEDGKIKQSEQKPDNSVNRDSSSDPEKESSHKTDDFHRSNLENPEIVPTPDHQSRSGAENEKKLDESEPQQDPGPEATGGLSAPDKSPTDQKEEEIIKEPVSKEAEAADAVAAREETQASKEARADDETGTKNGSEKSEDSETSEDDVTEQAPIPAEHQEKSTVIIEGSSGGSDDNPPADEEAGDSEGGEPEEEEAQLDYSNYSKKQMVRVLESLLKEDDFSQVGRILKEIKKPYDDLAEAERKAAYERYMEDGGEKDGFEYRPDELDQRFNLAFGKLKERKNQYYNSLEKQKEQNLNKKLEILEKLRQIVDSEETGTSIKALKDLQKQWKEVGVIPSSQVKSLWANYNALLDRFYDQRSIYFELKELDRKKNYDLKIELCEKAEKLSDQENIREVIKQLNELHEEFKHIGPVPKEDQEPVWERFKAASDKIYSKRKDYYEKLKGELKLNEVAKEALIEKVLPFSEFDSDRISDWNSKTKEIIAIQKEWEAIGSLPKEKAKAINKKFWTGFKAFFNKKGQFFKKIEEERRSNLKLKEELVDKAEALKDSDDFWKTSDELKRLQKRWKEIGPVPEKHRNEVFARFKKACDHFFNRRRENTGKLEKDYEENFKKKQKLCDELEKMAEEGKIDVERVQTIESEWGKIGFVPRSNIKYIQNRYTKIITEITDQVDIPEAEKHKMRFSAQFSNISYGPGAEKMIHKKEGALRRQIAALENDISVWKNNMDFFASSKNADKLKEEFQGKIDKANEQLQSLKEQLKIISNI